MEFDQPYELLQRENGIFQTMVHQNSKEEIERLTKVAKDSYQNIVNSQSNDTKYDSHPPIMTTNADQNQNDDDKRNGTDNDGFADGEEEEEEEEQQQQQQQQEHEKQS